MNYLLGLIGHPVSQSMSPPLHKAALSYFGLSGDYRLFDVEADVLAEKLPQLQRDGLHGFNITIPHKIAVYNLCKSLTPEAKAVGAANTVLFDANGGMSGHNTDYMGLHNALVDVVDSRRQMACVLGAGGAAKAALRVLEKLGFEKVVVLARDVEKAAQTLALSSQTFDSEILLKSTESTDDDASLLDTSSLVVNCLPLGQTIKDIPLWLNRFLRQKIAADTFIYDMVYSKTSAPTLLEGFARENGLKACDGMSMLCYQALYAFAFWTGQTPPYSVLENAFKAAKTE